MGGIERFKRKQLLSFHIHILFIYLLPKMDTKKVYVDVFENYLPKKGCGACMFFDCRILSSQARESHPFL